MSEDYSHSTIDLVAGVMVIPVACDPRDKIVKIRAEMVGDEVSINAVVNCGYAGEIHYSDTATVLDGDRIYAEPDGLVILKPNASTDEVARIEGRLILIATRVDDTLMIYRTEEA